ncbi:MAG TPA: 50S ribosomal protein L23 [Elusimicrobiales bacterium]|nr:50S ribosomal protein L23 [Elusimicrobiales bacterium]
MKKETYDIIVKPMLTEKSLSIRDKENRYSFAVCKSATKSEIKQAIEKLFKVKVTKVRTFILPGKLHRMGQFQGYRPDWKKAIVTLKAGNKIDIAQT